MRIKFIKKLAIKIPIRYILIVPFILQILIAVSLTGYLSFRSGEESVNEISKKLRAEITNLVSEYVNNYLQEPKQLHQIMVNAIVRGEFGFDLNQVDVNRDLFLWQQVQVFDNVSWISLGSEENGDYLAINKNIETGDLRFVIANRTTNNLTTEYSATLNGKRDTLIQSFSHTYDSRKRPWYIGAVKANKPTWFPVYYGVDYPRLFLSFGQPIYDPQGKLLGVCVIDFALEHISKYLQSLEVGKTGETFIIERTGKIIASSNSDLKNSISSQKDPQKRIDATKSSNPLIRASAKHIQDYFPNLQSITETTQLDFYINGKKQLLQVTPFSDEYGIDWLIVVVFPESDFMETIETNVRQTIFLCTIALLFVIVSGMITSRLISRAVGMVSQASESLAKGELQGQVPHQKIKELQILADSFNRMSCQLQQSFQKLEHRVQERTVELSLEKEKSDKLLLNILPPTIAQKLKNNHNSIADHHQEVTILFADIVGFTPLAEKLHPLELVDLLNCIFSQFDDLAETLGVEKIKTIGDAYMVAAGLPIYREDHAEVLAEMAIAMLKIIQELRQETNQNFQMRIGMNTGMVVAGVIGTKKFIYDLWGDAVNTASRMESSGEPGKIQVTEETYQRLRDRYSFQKRGQISVKGKGKMVTYWLCNQYK